MFAWGAKGLPSMQKLSLPMAPLCYSPLVVKNGVALAKGPSKTKVTGLDVVGWFLGSQKGTRAGQFFSRFFIVLLNSPHRETPKNVINKIEKKSVLGFLSIFGKNFSTRLFCKTFFVAFLNPHR
jgi:hypothetical protein